LLLEAAPAFDVVAGGEPVDADCPGLVSQDRSRNHKLTVDSIRKLLDQPPDCPAIQREVIIGRQAQVGRDRRIEGRRGEPVLSDHIAVIATRLLEQALKYGFLGREPGRKNLGGDVIPGGQPGCESHPVELRIPHPERKKGVDDLRQGQGQITLIIGRPRKFDKKRIVMRGNKVFQQPLLVAEVVIECRLRDPGAGRNFFEIAHSLRRQFGPEGIYRDLLLYSFADNHDVNRVASLLKDERDLFPLYALLFTMPGTPSIYYGSEWGYKGKKKGGDDGPLRPAFAWPVADATKEHPELEEWIARLADTRHDTPALQCGDYEEIHVDSEQLAFLRRYDNMVAVVVVNAVHGATPLRLDIPLAAGVTLTDALDPAVSLTVRDGMLDLGEFPAATTRILIGSTN
jgi:hypothetical protein